MSDSVQPHRWQSTRLCHPWDSPGKITRVGCHFLFQCMKVKVKSLSRVRLLATPWTAAYQAPPPMGFSRQEYRSGLPLLSLQLSVRIGKTNPYILDLANADLFGRLCGLSQIEFLPRCGRILFFFSDFVLSNYSWFYSLVCRSVLLADFSFISCI